MSGRPPPVTAQEATNTIKVIEAAWQSQQEHRTILLNEQKGR